MRRSRHSARHLGVTARRSVGLHGRGVRPCRIGGIGRLAGSNGRVIAAVAASAAAVLAASSGVSSTTSLKRVRQRRENIGREIVGQRYHLDIAGDREDVIRDIDRAGRTGALEVADILNGNGFALGGCEGLVVSQQARRKCNLLCRSELPCPLPSGHPASSSRVRRHCCTPTTQARARRSRRLLGFCF